MQSVHVRFDFFDHEKTTALIGLLGKGSEVIPIRLWCFAGKPYAETGTLARYSAQEIETGVKWWGKAGACAAALAEARFVDCQADGRFVIHDWEEHARHLVTNRERALKAAKARWGFADGDAPSIENSCSTDNASPSVVSGEPADAPSMKRSPQVPPRSPSPTPRSSPSSKDDSGERRAGESLAEKVRTAFGGKIPTNHGGRSSVVLSASLVEDLAPERRSKGVRKPAPSGKERRRQPPADWTSVEALDALDRVILAWKLVSETDIEDKGWDAVHYSRATAAAADLLRYFGDYGLAGWCIAWVWQDIAVRAKRVCTLETVVKHSDRYKTSDDYRRRMNDAKGD